MTVIERGIYPSHAKIPRLGLLILLGGGIAIEFVEKIEFNNFYFKSMIYDGENGF